MRKSQFTFLFCLVLSAGLHLAFAWKARDWYGFGGNAYLPPKVQKKEPKVAPPGTIPDPPPPAVDSNTFRMGEAGGAGRAVNSSPGERPQSAPESNPDQAAWTRDPSGRGPVRPPTPEPRPLQQAVVAPPPAALPTPPESKAPAFRKPPPPQPKADVAEKTNRSPEPKPRTPQPERPAVQAGGTPLPQSDQDSDPFAKEVTVEFTPGGVTATDGRQVKFKKPRVNMSGYVEAGEIRFPARIRFRIRIKPNGMPAKVDVIGSSGSRSIDRAFELSAYESWFEPRKNAAGEPIGDEFTFSVVLRG